MSKKSIILHLDSLEILNELNNEQKGILFDAIYQYNLGNEIELDFALKIAFLPFKNQFKRDNESYNKIMESNSNAGKIGNLKRWNNDLYLKVIENELSIEEAEAIARNRKVSQSIAPPILESQGITNNRLNKNDNKNDNKKDNINEIPTFDLFFHFLTEKYIELNLVAEKYRYEWKLKYDSWVVNGWKDGNGKQIKNWKQKALNTLKYIDPKEQKSQYYEMPL
jgi:hypothetical protein